MAQMDNHDVAWGTTIRSPELTCDHFDEFASQCSVETGYGGFAPENSRAEGYDLSTRMTGSGNMHETFGSLLRVLRCEADLTLEQVASAVGVAKPSVWAWENGKAKPKREKWQALARVLGVSPQVLMDAAKAEALNKAASLVMRGGDVDRTGMLAAGREMIAKAYGVTPSAVRIMVEI